MVVDIIIIGVNNIIVTCTKDSRLPYITVHEVFIYVVLLRPLQLIIKMILKYV